MSNHSVLDQIFAPKLFLRLAELLAIVLILDAISYCLNFGSALANWFK